MKFHLHKLKTSNSKQDVLKFTSVYGWTIGNHRGLEPGNSR